MDVQGVFAHSLAETFFELPKNALDVKLADALRSSQRVAVRMLLSNGSQVRWQVQDATLVRRMAANCQGSKSGPGSPSLPERSRCSWWRPTHRGPCLQAPSP
jgi:hypothetical protein